MNKLLLSAIDYAEKGFLVFPIHTVMDGVCSCHLKSECKSPGKHPRTSNGLKDATKDIEKIKHFWACWPDSNIAIATGRESGILVLDVDINEKLKHHMDVLDFHGLQLPKTLTQQSGGNGRHYFYKYPETGEYKTKAGLFLNIDSKGKGGCINVTPSLHMSGRNSVFYTDSGSIERDLISEAPQWLLDKTEVKENDYSAEAPTWNPNGHIPEFGLEALEACADDANHYDTWLRVGLAVHYTDPGPNGFAAWDWWSSLSEKYDQKSVEREWRNFSRRGHKTGSPITFDSIFGYANEKGWENPGAIEGAEIAKLIIESDQRKQALKIKKAVERIEIERPLDMIPPSGLIKDMYDHIISSSLRPQHELAIAASISFIGALAGRKYQTQTGLRTNVYIVGIAESGSGKDHARKIIKKLASDAECMKFVGGEDFASGQAIISAMERNPSQVFLIDEFGRKLKAATSEKSSSHLKDIITTLLVLYSSAGSTYFGKEYADQTAKPRVELENPNACVYGTTVPSEFYDSLSSSEGINGTLSRFILFEAPTKRPDRQRPLINLPTGAIVDQIKKLSEFSEVKGNLVGVLDEKGSDIEPKTVLMNDDVYESWESLDDYCTELMRCPISSAVYSRVAENAAKLALIYAISINIENPSIDRAAMHWGGEIALWTANILVNRSNDRVSDNQVESNLKSVLRVIKSFGENGCTKSELTRKVYKLRKAERSEIIETLLETEEILYKSDATKKGSVARYYSC